MRIFVIGSSPYADIAITGADGQNTGGQETGKSVAPRHAELVVTGDGRHHLTDCASGAGTWQRAGDGSWATIRQGFVELDTKLRFAHHETTLRDLLRHLPADAPGRWHHGGGPKRGKTDGNDLPTGRVERDPVTGEIVRKAI